ncbi:MAG: glycerol-3-phosphate dehydrogenase/oxidase [Balneolales bacterium]|nr:glycerol-3-phosphate dehydrogenase/oxidase [Balneolales bacterium]
MKRQQMLDEVRNYSGFWDVIIIGGGATGLGSALEAASRGYKTLLLEKYDFSKGTSSRSTKLVHGGVRYLQQGNVSLVLEALRERGLMIQNAPHLCRNQSFVVPNYDWWGGPFYGVGMKVYDMLAGKLGLGPSKILSREETIKRLPTIEPEGLRGGVIYYDGQFDDSRLSINLAQTAAEQGGCLLNYMSVEGIIKSKDNIVQGVKAVDTLSNEEYEINGRVVINATGVFTDSILKMDNPESKPMIKPSQGIHIVLDKEFLPGDSAIMVPQTDDGRVLFAVPWHDKVVVGTTDTAMDAPDFEPRALEEEINFVMVHAARYLTKDPEIKDVRSVFAGLRPLVKPQDDKGTAAISRDHTLLVSESGLVTITGGKWTTYRKMGQDTIDQAAIVAGLETRNCVTENMRIHGWLKNTDKDDNLHLYGSDAPSIRKLYADRPDLKELLHKDLPYIRAEVVWAARNEMAMTVEDVLARRTRAILLNAKASMEVAADVASLLAEELGYDEAWQKAQVDTYKKLAEGYTLS